MGPFEEAAARVKALRREAGAVPAWAKAERLERSVPEKELYKYGENKCIKHSWIFKIGNARIKIERKE